MPVGAWIPQIHASRYDADEAFVVVNDYRRNNWKPLFISHDEWREIMEANCFRRKFSWVLLEFLFKILLCLTCYFWGQNMACLFQFDKGENWNQWKHGFPNVSTIDLKIQEREKDLVIGDVWKSCIYLG